MSRLFGDMFQVAYLVDDLQAGIDHWTGNLGVGPFLCFPLPLSFSSVSLFGKPVPLDTDIFAGVGIAYSGDVMVELIQPGTAPSHYHAFRAAGRTGAHHIATLATDYDSQLTAALARGYKAVFEGVTEVSRFAYLDTDRDFPGTVMELVEAEQSLLDIFTMVKAASRDWDGTDPVRQM